MAKGGPVEISASEEGIWFYYQLGRAITSWAHVEQALCWVGCCSFVEDDQTQFIVSFFSIENFRSKLQVVDRLIAHKFKQHVDSWEPIKDDLVGLSKIRNQLAHYPVMNYGNNTPGQRIALLPRFGQPSKFKQTLPKPPSGALGIRDIAHAERRFTALMFKLEAFKHTLLGTVSIFPAAAAEAKNVPRLQDIARTMRKILKAD